MRRLAAMDTGQIEESIGNLFQDIDALERLSHEEIRILRNGLFARYGRTFADPNLAALFQGTSWYRTDPRYRDARVPSPVQRAALCLSLLEGRRRPASEPLPVWAEGRLTLLSTGVLLDGGDTLTGAIRLTATRIGGYGIDECLVDEEPMVVAERHRTAGRPGELLVLRLSRSGEGFEDPPFDLAVVHLGRQRALHLNLTVSGSGSVSVESSTVLRISEPEEQPCTPPRFEHIILNEVTRRFEFDESTGGFRKSVTRVSDPWRLGCAPRAG